MFRNLLILGLVGVGAAPATADHAVTWAGTRFTVLLSAEESNGKMGVFLSEGAANSGPALHVHEDADEAFYVLEGRLKVIVDGVVTEVGPGEVAFAPKGSEHTFRILEGADGRHVTTVTPGGFEGFFSAVEGTRIPQDMARINEVAARFNLRFTGPPLQD